MEGRVSGNVAAVDLGATSGRVIIGHVGPGELRLEQVARFPNQPVRSNEGVGAEGESQYGLHWNILELYRSLTEGLGTAIRSQPELASIGIDAWAVDYALLRGGRMLGVPYHYRDDRTAAGVAAVHGVIGADELYQRNGLQQLPFNTVFQLAADRASGDLAAADGMLLIPDLIGYWLTGVARAEITNASTTGLLDPVKRSWDTELLARTGVPASLLPALIEPGQVLGPLLPAVAAELGGNTGGARAARRSQPISVIAVGSHDTASAVVAVPATGPDFAYISSGTWSLVGVELDHPLISEAGRAANFTNEGGVDRRVRYLKNVSGLWLLSESVRTWERTSRATIDLPTLLAQADAVTSPVAVFDASDERFIAPGDMPARIASWCVEHGMPAPQSPAEFTRSIIESLAAAYADTIELAASLTGTSIAAIHVVGGGSQNALLCQLTADRTGRPVLAGPVEATAIGNVLVQARANGMLDGSLESLRALVAATFVPRRYEPRGR
ncbi:MAG: rhamnulokinase [Subtercola sp.]|nr:rhamnulokinase [Subtercola sp.]